MVNERQDVCNNCFTRLLEMQKDGFLSGVNVASVLLPSSGDPFAFGAQGDSRKAALAAQVSLSVRSADPYQADSGR